MIELPEKITAMRPYYAAYAISNLIDSGQFAVDASKLKFVDPFGMCFLASAGLKLSERGEKLHLVNLDKNLASYLSRMDVLGDFVSTDTPVGEIKRNDLSRQLLEVFHLHDENQIDDTANRLTEAIIGSVGLDNDAPLDEMTCLNDVDRIKIPFLHLMSELLGNSLSHGKKFNHSKSSSFVASQYYKKHDIIAFSVIDNGCGFLETLKWHRDLKIQTHANAIELALQAKISCNPAVGVYTDTSNAGVGLTISSEIAKHSLGKMMIMSGDAMTTLDSDRILRSKVPYWQGVAISVIMRKSPLMGIKFFDLVKGITERDEQDTSDAQIRFE